MIKAKNTEQAWSDLVEQARSPFLTRLMCKHVKAMFHDNDMHTFWMSRMQGTQVVLCECDECAIKNSLTVDDKIAWRTPYIIGREGHVKGLIRKGAIAEPLTERGKKMLGEAADNNSGVN